MASKGTPAQATEVKKTELPAWVDNASQENYNLAKTVAERPLEQYQGTRVAGEAPLTLQGYDLAAGGSGADPYIKQAGDLYSQSAGPLDIPKYLNPFTAEVERNAIGNAERSLTSNLNSITSQQKKSGVFGGSRGEIENAVTRSEGIRGIGDLSGQIRKQGFDTATSTALADRTGMQNAAGGLLSTAGTKLQDWVQQLQSLFMGGQQQQGQQQKVIDADMAKWQEARQNPIDALNIRLAALGMSPYGKTETGNKTSTAEKLPTDWATLGLGALKAAPSLMMMSDRRMKTDIKKVGDDPLAGIPIYAYRYKGDPKSYPKVVGPMAQDIEKKFPSAVKKVGRYKAVDIDNLMEVLS